MQHYPKLKTLLLVDTVITALIAVDLLFFSERIAAIMGTLEDGVYFALGIGLAIYAADLASMVISASLRHRFAKWTLFADGLWIAATIVLIVGYPEFWTVSGTLILTAGALFVAGLAIFKQLTHRQGPNGGELKAPLLKAL